MTILKGLKIVKKIILSLFMLGSLSSNCLASQLSEAQKAELMKFTIPPNGASYQFDDTKERLALVETDETLLNREKDRCTCSLDKI